jgi:hypothetical protein
MWWSRWIREKKRLHFDQVLDFSIHHFDQVTDFFDQKTVFGFFHTDEKFSCMSSNAYESDTEWWSYENNLSRERSAQTSSWSSSRFRNLSFWLSLWSFLIKESFSNFFIQMENFFACHQMHAKAILITDRKYYRKWCDDRSESEEKNDDALFQKAMMFHFKKSWVREKKRWVLISKSDESEKKSDAFIQKSYKWLYRS